MKDSSFRPGAFLDRLQAIGGTRTRFNEAFKEIFGECPEGVTIGEGFIMTKAPIETYGDSPSRRQFKL